MGRFIACLGLSGCWFMPREVVISEPQLVEVAPVAVPPVPVPPICDPTELTRVVRTTDAVAEPLRAKAQVAHAVCQGDFAYSVVQFGEGMDAVPAFFVRKEAGWANHDLGTGLDCAEPAPPLTPKLCQELEKAWAAQGG
jgi:hypothetical protein